MDADAELDSNALISRLRVIEDQPLQDRAAAYIQLHDQLQHALEDGHSLEGGDRSA